MSAPRVPEGWSKRAADLRLEDFAKAVTGQAMRGDATLTEYLHKKG